MNVICISGRLTKDPELKYTANTNTAVLSFSVAVDDGFGDQKKVYFFSCVAWQKTAENISKFFKKGSLILIQGKLTQRTYETSEKKGTVFEIIVDKFDFGGSNNNKSAADLPLDEDELPF